MSNTSIHASLSPWQAVWYVTGVLLYPAGFAGLTLSLMNLGVRNDIAYLAALVGLPVLWLPLNHWLMRQAYQREACINPQILLEPREESLLSSQKARGLIR